MWWRSATNGLLPARTRRSISETQSASGSRITHRAAIGGKVRPTPCVRSIANHPSANPIMRLPASPRKTRACFCQGKRRLNSRNPAMAPQKMSAVCSCTSRPELAATAAYQAKATNASDPPSPSSPSIMLTEFTTPTIANTVMGMAKIHNPMGRHPRRSPTERSSTPAPQIMIAEATIWIANLRRGEISATSSHMPIAMMIDSAKMK